MSPPAFHAQLAAFVEVLANTAVAEICELVDSGYSLLQLEISRSRKENELLRRKLRLMELRAARTTALRAVVTAGGGRSGSVVPGGRGRVRAHPALLCHHRNEPKRNLTPTAEGSLSAGCHIAPPADSGQNCSAVTLAVGESIDLKVAIKIEDDSSADYGILSLSHSDQKLSFSGVDGRQSLGTEAPPLSLPQQGVAGESAGESSQSWTNGEVSSTSTSLHHSVSVGAGSDSLTTYEPTPLRQHGFIDTHNPVGTEEEPGCSYALNAGKTNSEAVGSCAGVSRMTLGIDEKKAVFDVSENWRPDVGGVSRADVSEEGGAGRSFVCNFCGKTLACLKNLKTHMRVHTGEKPFACVVCGKRFSDSSNLKRHQSVHTGEKRYVCVHCGKRFAQSGSLKVHMSVHVDGKQFCCSLCGKTFISAVHLRRHIAAHNREKRGANDATQ